MYEKFKSIIMNETLFMALLLILVGVVSFGLGRESVKDGGGSPAPSAPAGVIFTDSPSNSSSSALRVESKVIEKAIASNRVVASKSGTKYHLLTCPGASQIKEENKIYFDSFDLARAAGYTPAANCPGL